MHVCKKHKDTTYSRGIIYIYVLLVIFLFSSNSTAGTYNITIESADGVFIENIYNVNANITYQLGAENRKALEHGIPLEFDIEFRIKKHRPWIWDQTLITRTIMYRLEYQPLSGDFLVTRLNDGELEQFQNLEDVLKYIGRINNFPMIDAALLETGEVFYAQVKIYLNIETLPAPLRPLAYISSEWRLSSPWLTWMIQE